MIVVDTSALLAVFFDEAEKVVVQHRIIVEDKCLISAVNVHEAMTVVRLRRGKAALVDLEELFVGLCLELSPFDRAQVQAAAAAFDRYGKGIDFKARLNICDCAAYALAKTLGVPLLFKGDDFAATDIVPAV